MKIIDNWVDKWGYILRSLKKKTNNISSDLTGGFDSRILLSIILNSGVNMNQINIFSAKDNKNNHDIDFKIATNISSKFGFKLNNYNLDKNGTNWSPKETLYNSIYSKLGFHKQFCFQYQFYTNPIFSFAGSNGESLRGTPGIPIQEYINSYSPSVIFGHEKEFDNSSNRLFNRTINLLKKERDYKNDFEFSSSLYSKSNGKNHFGKLALERFMANTYTLQPLMDPDINMINFTIKDNHSHDLIAYIYVRFAHELIYFPFQSKKFLDPESIKKAERLNKNFKSYNIKSDYNNNFYIDQERRSPVHSSKNNKNVFQYLNELLKSPRYIFLLNKIYDNSIYNWANGYINKTNYFPLSHHYSLLAIAITIENLLLNEKYLKKRNRMKFYKTSNIINDLFIY